jgi:predicted nicotinamide N-methyase
MPQSNRTERVAPPESLRRRFELAATQVTIAGHDYDLLRPKSVDDLISEEDFAIEERIPYWADCWPSARILAERVSREQGRERGALELGCGIGLVSLAAARVGFRVLATDYYADALEFTSANAQRHGLRSVDTRLVDWRKLPADLGTFHVVAASDVLYEGWHAALIAAALASTLTAGGLGLVSDPGRRTAPAFVEECLRMGLVATCAQRVPTHDADAALTVSIFEIRRA